jgi:electron transfer flavoprotein alpha subunit
MAGNIWVLAEQWRGRVSEITYETLALGREIADGLGVKLQAVLLGHGVRELARSLGKADSVLYADHPELAEPLAEPQAKALAQLVRERAPQAVLIPLTNVGLGVGTTLGVDLQAPSVNFCKDLRVVDGGLEAYCVLYGGKIEARVTVREGAVLGIWPGARPPEKGRAAVEPPVEDLAVTLEEETTVRFLRYIEPEPGDVDLTRKDALVGIGRGIQSEDNVALAEELAEALGGAVCGSRPVIDQGWLPLARQIGKSGLTVKPKLYVALGISGAPEHVEGMSNSGLIVAVNTDPEAPIFNVAHYGIVADVMDVVPALTERLLARKG